jgi:hypothetical protein
MAQLQPVSLLPRLAALLPAAVLTGLVLALPTARADGPKDEKKAAKDAPEVVLPMDVIPPAAWKKATTTPLQPGEIDRLINAALDKAGVVPSPRTSDEQFIRRVYLDVTGKLPMPADVTDFLKDADPQKRAKLIDRLLDSEDYARHWSRYWREVATAQITDQFALFSAGAFETWMAEQLRKNVSWSEITRLIITATGEMRLAEPNKNGAAFLYLARRGADSTAERAADTSRIFLGIQIQCAQCHDHPFDEWKRIQFHEFAAFLARAKERPIFEEKKLKGFRLVSLPFAEQRMEDRNKPEKKTVVYPKFLDGSTTGARLGDAGRRQALAKSITSKDNPWFAAAFVNRMWGELMGQSFYKPIDDLGPRREAVLPEAITRLAGGFRGSDYDIKEFLRAVMNTETYQRQVRLGRATDEHLLFAASYPRRLQGEALWNSLECVLGQMNALPPGFRGQPGPFARFGGLRGQFLKEFSFDPSARPEEIEGSIPQALMMMNNPQINQKIRAVGTNLLARILKAYPRNDEALTILYQRTLARRPSDRELTRCLAHIDGAGNRAEAFEDILWVLLNSTEFQTKR